MAHHYQHLGPFSDWVEAARGARPAPVAPPGPGTRGRVREALGFVADQEVVPPDVRVERRWERDGLAGEEVSWSVGYGPRTHGFVLKPAGTRGPLPGVVALHGHDSFAFHGKEKIADGPQGVAPGVAALRARMYAGRAFADDLAREGFVVLAHDAFGWGSRRFPPQAMPDRVRRFAEATAHLTRPEDVPKEVAWHNAAAWHHEHVLEKYCRVLGTTMAGVVNAEDRIAVAYLQARRDVVPGGVGCVGLSGGGCRAALLQATCEQITAAVIVGMMCTYEGLLDHNVAGHTWMLFPEGWARHGDWPDLAACRAPSPLLVQHNLEDHLFTPEGMRAAHERIAAHYRAAGQPDAYTGQFYDGPHKFDFAMQKVAFAWLHQHLDSARPPGRLPS